MGCAKVASKSAELREAGQRKSARTLTAWRSPNFKISWLLLLLPKERSTNSAILNVEKKGLEEDLRELGCEQMVADRAGNVKPGSESGNSRGSIRSVETG